MRTALFYGETVTIIGPCDPAFSPSPYVVIEDEAGTESIAGPEELFLVERDPMWFAERDVHHAWHALQEALTARTALQAGDETNPVTPRAETCVYPHCVCSASEECDNDVP